MLQLHGNWSFVSLAILGGVLTIVLVWIDRDVRQADGWYIGHFEHSEFIPENGAVLRGRLENGKCSVRTMNTDPRLEQWWASWSPSANDEPLPGFHRDGIPMEDFGWNVGFFETRGHLSEKGRHGHLGAYDREYRIVESNLNVCKTVAHLGHCAMPGESYLGVYHQNCVIIDRTPSQPSNRVPHFRKFYLTRRKRPAGGNSYELLLRADDPPLDSAISVQFTVPSVPLGQNTLLLEELMDQPSLGVNWNDAGVEIFEYRNVKGWVGHPPRTKNNSISISVSGTTPVHNSNTGALPERVHVWGVYTVDSVKETTSQNSAE